MRIASPSAIAVFPTPGSPIRQGLFFVRRQSICITREISFSRPITASIFPALAFAVKLVQYESRYLRFVLCFMWVCFLGDSFFGPPPCVGSEGLAGIPGKIFCINGNVAAPPGTKPFMEFSSGLSPLESVFS